MRLFKKESTNDYVISKDLSVGAIGMLNSLLIRSNNELANIDLYSLSNDSRKEVALAFRELRKKKYIIYSSLDDTRIMLNIKILDFIDLKFLCFFIITSIGKDGL